MLPDTFRKQNHARNMLPDTFRKQNHVCNMLPDTFFFQNTMRHFSMVFTSPFPGAEIRTLLAPPAICPLAFSESVNNPVDSITISTPNSFHGNCEGSFCAKIHLILFPLTTCSELTHQSIFLLIFCFRARRIATRCSLN